VDTTNTVTHISLCAGYGGIDLGLKRAIPSIRTILFSEIESFAIANLVSKMEKGFLDAAPIWTNLKTLPWDGFLGKVDILSGGFPCQPFSSAGKRDGDEDPRHLFPFILDGIRRCRPSVVFLENVEGILSSKLAGDQWRDPAETPVLLHVLRELERVGYRATAGIFSASETGAVHQRKRVFIMAVSHSIGGQARISRSLKGDERESGVFDYGCGQIWPSRPGQPQYTWEPPRVVVNSNKPRLQGGQESHTQEWEEHSCHGASIFGGIAHPSNDGATEVMVNSSEQGSQIGGGLGIMEQEGRVSEDQRGKSTPSIEQSGDSCGTEMGNSQWIHEHKSFGNGEEFSKSRDASSSMGNSSSIRPHRGGKDGVNQQPEMSWQRLEIISDSECSKTQPLMGGNLDGTASGVGDAELPDSNNSEGQFESDPDGGQLDDTRGNESHGIPDQQWQEDPASWESSYAELCTSCDNRTDELRLLGNGVVPATATLAFRTLWEELTK
jgi:DNA-cytosine methyltransferase